MKFHDPKSKVNFEEKKIWKFIAALLPNQQHVFFRNHIRFNISYVVQCGIHVASRIGHIAVGENLSRGETNEVWNYFTQSLKRNIYILNKLLKTKKNEHDYNNNIQILPPSSNPPLYKENTGNKRLTWKYFVGWMLLGCYHSVVIYMSGYAMWINNPAILSTERTADFQSFGTFMIHNVVVLVNFKLWMEAKYQTIWFILSIIGSILFFVTSTVIYNLFIL